MEAAAVAFVHDAFAHLKVIGYTEAATGLLAKAGAGSGQAGMVALGSATTAQFVDAAKRGRIWAREPSVRQTI